ncbi:hypothetical protein BDF22DRAFT_669999 [Syncephalis plumigaleata]|nr:hypothetical protein BDF22DRAFT_669999 [Syncephalis plumigaleata]
MDADDQEPGTNGPVHYHHLAPVQPPIINITSNETNNVAHDVNETTLDVPSTTVTSSNISVLINVEDEEEDEEEEDEDELNSETDDATSVDASIHQQHPPVQVELGWNESNAADEWVRAWHRLHATYRPTFETFYTAEPIPGYRAITGFNSWYRKSISSTDWDLEQLNHSKNNSNDNDDDDDHGRSRIDSLITGGYTGDSGISVRYEHHPMYGFRIVWLRVSFAWLLSGWFVSAPDTRGPGATAMSTAYQQQQQQHNEYNGRGRVSFTSPLVSQRVQALDPYSHISITPSMGQTLVSSNGTWLGPVRPIFLLDGPDGVAAPETASLIGRSRHYGKGRRLLRRMHRTGRDFCRKLSCIPLNNRNGRNETRRSSPISTRRPHFFPVSATPTTTTGPATSRASHLFLPDPMPEPYRPPPHQASLPIYASRLYELQTAIETYGKFSSNELATLIRDSMSSMALSSSSSSGPLHDALLLSNTLNDTSNPLHWLTDPYNPMTIAWCAGELDCTALEFLQWQCTQMASGD